MLRASPCRLYPSEGGARELPPRHQKVFLSPLKPNTTLRDSSLKCRLNPIARREANYGFGTCNVLLTIKHAISRNRPVQGCTSSSVPSISTPKGIFSCIQPPLVMIAPIVRVVKQAKGMGVPSKYFDFPDASFGNIATVTLKRASRVRPHRT